MNELPKRKQNRLPHYDYSQNGLYHITICTDSHKKILSDIMCADDELSIIPQINLTKTGKIVNDAIIEIPIHYPMVSVEKYVIMPNHVHLLISIYCEEKNDDGRLIIAPTVSRVIQQMKSHVTKQANRPVWQKGFYDHVIKNDKDHESVWRYIDENPIKWESDEYY